MNHSCTRPGTLSAGSAIPRRLSVFGRLAALTALLFTLPALAVLPPLVTLPILTQGTLNPVFTGEIVKSNTGDSIVPIAWVHEDLLARGEADVTFLFLYHDATTGEQSKLATVTAPVADDGSFESAGWGDVGEIHGTIGRTVIVERVVISNGKEPRDELVDLTFTIQGQPSAAPATGRWPLIQILPLAVSRPEYTDFWTVELTVETNKGKTRALLDYYGPDGTYAAEPVNIEADGSFRGTAGSTREGVRFAGVFLTLDDGRGGAAADFPLLVQAPTKGGTAWRTSEAVGTRPILWLTENDSRKSGVDLHSAHYSTATQAQKALDTLFEKGKVLAADTDDATTRGTTNPPNDTYFNPGGGNPGQYPYPVYNAWLCCTANIVPVRNNDAWGVNNATGQGISLAVLDSGVMANHPDLQGRIQGGHNALRWPWWIDWLRLWTPANWRTTTTDLYGHGTGVSGVATAVRNNNEGIAGVAQPGIRPVRVLDQHNAASDTSVAEGLQWLLDNDHGDIINMSFVSQSGADTHGGDWDPVVAELVRRAVDGGRVLVGGSGNIPTPVVLPPASMPDVIAVGASDPNQDPTDYTAFGKNLDLLAPGGDNQNQADYITVPWRANYNCADLPFDNDPNYCRKFGTSFAAPFVSGVVSMILTVRPNLQRTHANCSHNVQTRKACVAQIRTLVQRTGQAVQTPNWGLANVTDIYDVDAFQAATANLPAPLPPATNLQVANCAAGNCINPGIQLQWNAALAPGGFNLLGYLVFRNGRPIFQNLPSPNPVVVNGTNYNDTSLPAVHGGVPRDGTYTYTVIALYQDANNHVYEQSISSNHVRKSCTAAGCN